MDPQIKSNVIVCFVIACARIPFGPSFKPANFSCYIIHTGANVNSYVIAWDSCGRSIWPRQVEFEPGPFQLSGGSQNIRQPWPRHQQPTSDGRRFQPKFSESEHLTQFCREIHALGWLKGEKRDRFHWWLHVLIVSDLGSYWLFFLFVFFLFCFPQRTNGLMGAPRTFNLIWLSSSWILHTDGEPGHKTARWHHTQSLAGLTNTSAWLALTGCLVWEVKDLGSVWRMAPGTVQQRRVGFRLRLFRRYIRNSGAGANSDKMLLLPEFFCFCFFFLCTGHNSTWMWAHMYVCVCTWSSLHLSPWNVEVLGVQVTTVNIFPPVL